MDKVTVTDITDPEPGLLEADGHVTITLGLQVAQNLAMEIKGNDASLVLQVLQEMSTGLEANTQRVEKREAMQERPGLIIPEIVPSGPLREDRKK